MSSTVDVDDIYVMIPPGCVHYAGEETARAAWPQSWPWLWTGSCSRSVTVNCSGIGLKARAWLAEVLGPPDRVQVGGTGPQAAWALDVLRAPGLWP